VASEVHFYTRDRQDVVTHVAPDSVHGHLHHVYDALSPPEPGVPYHLDQDYGLFENQPPPPTPKNPPPTDNQQPASFGSLVLDLAEDTAKSFINTKLNQNPALRALGLMGAVAVAEVTDENPQPASEPRQSWREWFASFIPFVSAGTDIVAGSDIAGQAAVNRATRQKLYNDILSGRGDVTHGMAQGNTLGSAGQAAKGLAEAAIEFGGVAPGLAAASAEGLGAPKAGNRFGKPKAVPTQAAEAVRLHHAWAKYLGGAEKQDLVPLSKALHDAYHSGLDKILPRKWGTAYYDGLKGAARLRMYELLRDYTKAFDSQYGTKLFKAMRKEGFPLP
jgi:hypothetical protein